MPPRPDGIEGPGPALRVLCWDHPRCVAPVRAAAAAYPRVVPGAAITWTARPLAAFNDQPIDEAVRGHDIVIFDHPMVPRAARSGALLPLDTLPGGAGTDAIGASQDSYVHDGHTYGLAADAACQVAAARADLLPGPAPATWDAVLELASGGRVALPLYPSDAICSLISMSAAAARAAGEPDTWLRLDAVRTLCALVAAVDDACFALNPPALLDAMVTGDRWAYAPLAFGYTDYSRPAAARRITWHDAPGFRDGMPGSVLGGAGLGVPRDCPRPEAAAAFARWFTDPVTQRDLVLPAGGQPAARAVWLDPAADRATGGFLSGTRRTTETAYVRPAVPWWPDFQDRAGRALHELLRAGASPARVHDDLIKLHDEYPRLDTHA